MRLWPGERRNGKAFAVVIAAWMTAPTDHSAMPNRGVGAQAHRRGRSVRGRIVATDYFVIPIESKG